MPVNEKIADRIREALAHIKKLEEKKMFSGMCFMVNDKMCICLNDKEIMCRIDHDIYEEVLERDGVRPMDMKGKPMKGYVYVDFDNIKKNSELDYWVKLCLEFNSKAKSSKKKK
jgi:TfoX/Sxy family transcriptional regulator of competence genes